jgi:hypothetical protein
MVGIQNQEIYCLEQERLHKRSLEGQAKFIHEEKIKKRSRADIQLDGLV